MDENKQPFILNRSKNLSSPASEEHTSSILQNSNSAINEPSELASSFPNWDLRPPSMLIKRKRSKTL